jgi:pyruvate,water dikinase
VTASAPRADALADGLVGEYVRPFSELRRGDVGFAGGKGANLGELLAAGLPVPAGFVVGAPAYAAFCDAGGLRSRIAERLAGIDVEDTAALERAADELRAEIELEPLPAPIADAVLAAYGELAEGGPEPAVAVRSSATGEDTETASWARR